MNKGYYYSGFNFLLSFIGMILSFYLIPDEEWASLGLYFALFPIIGLVSNLQLHQFFIVQNIGSSNYLIFSVIKKLFSVYLVTIPIIFCILFFVFSFSFFISILIVSFSFFFSLRTVQKYSLTIESHAENLYKSNCVSICIWMVLLVVLSTFKNISAVDRVLVNLVGEFFAFFIVLDKQTKISNLLFRESIGAPANFLRILLRQINYNMPVYITNYFFSDLMKSQIGILSRVRVIIDQTVNTLLVIYAKKIIGFKFRLRSAIFLIFLIFVFLSVSMYFGFSLLSYFFEYEFSSNLLLWFIVFVSVWAVTTPLVFYLETKNKISHLFFVEIFYTIFVSISAALVFLNLNGYEKLLDFWR